VANLATSPASAKIRPAITGPMPNRPVRPVPGAVTGAAIWPPRYLSLASRARMSARWSRAICTRIAATSPAGRIRASSAWALFAVSSRRMPPDVSSASNRCSWHTAWVRSAPEFLTPVTRCWCCTAGEVVSTDRLVDELWGERTPAAAAKTVQVYVSHLRKALGAGEIVTRGRGYRLAAAPGQVDAVRFEALAGEGRRALAGGDAARAREQLGAALGLWRGEPFAEFAYEPFAQGDIGRLREARLAAVEDRIEADLALGPAVS
jgi:hypothetical protein